MARNESEMRSGTMCVSMTKVTLKRVVIFQTSVSVTITLFILQNAQI